MLIEITCFPVKILLTILKNSFPLSICTWFLQISSLKYWVWWTGFLVYFKLEFFMLQQAEESSSNKKKSSSSNLIFKLENCKLQVQIDRSVHLFFLAKKLKCREPCLKFVLVKKADDTEFFCRILTSKTIVVEGSFQIEISS